MICTKPPTGWHCTRNAGHAGPCAAVQMREVPMRTTGETAFFCIHCGFDVLAVYDMSTQCPARDGDVVCEGKRRAPKKASSTDQTVILGCSPDVPGNPDMIHRRGSNVYIVGDDIGTTHIGVAANMIDIVLGLIHVTAHYRHLGHDRVTECNKCSALRYVLEQNACVCIPLPKAPSYTCGAYDDDGDQSCPEKATHRHIALAGDIDNVICAKHACRGTHE